MAGVLSGFGNGGGILANRPRLGGFLSNNANALLGFGAGIFSGQGPSALGQGFQGWMQGAQLDQQNMERLRQEEERQRRLDALSGAYGTMNLSPELLDLYEAFPELGAQAAVDYYTPEPVEPAAPPDYPSSYDEFQLMQENPEYAEWMMREDSPLVLIEGDEAPAFGPIPAGMARIPDPSSETGYRLVAEPGGAVEEERAAAAAQAEGQRTTELTAANVVVEDIDYALGLAGAWTTGLLGAGASLIPGTPAADLAATINTIEANVAFNALQEMRNNSPTGGALGAVTERELQLLSSTLGSLKQSQSEAAFRRNLERLKVIYLDVIHGAGNWTYGPGGEVMLYGVEGSVPDAAPAAEDPDPFGIL